MSASRTVLLHCAAALLLAAAAPSRPRAHDDGTKPHHVKGTLKTASGQPIAGAQLDPASVHVVLRTTSDPRLPPVSSGCVGYVKSVTNPTDAGGRYEVIIQFKDSVQETIIAAGTGSATVNTIDCTETARTAQVNPKSFVFRKAGLTGWIPVAQP